MSLNLGIPTKSETNVPVQTSLAEVIQSMLFGLGDCNKPLISTAKMIETVLIRQMVALLDQAEEISIRRGSTKIELEDILFLLRKDKTKLKRLLNFIDLKDTKNWNNYTISDSQIDKDVIKPKPPQRKEKCLMYLQSIGVTDVCNYLSQDDDATLERKYRNSFISEELSISNGDYGEFIQSRTVSFLQKDKVKLWDALKKRAPTIVAKVKSNVEDVISFLAKDTIANVIDLALLVRVDELLVPERPFSRAWAQYQAQSRGPITPEEVKEVIRRYYSDQLCPFGIFTRQTSSSVDRKLLAC